MDFQHQLDKEVINNNLKLKILHKKYLFDGKGGNILLPLLTALLIYKGNIYV